jgi:hypothetical protein
VTTCDGSREFQTARRIVDSGSAPCQYLEIEFFVFKINVRVWIFRFYAFIFGLQARVFSCVLWSRDNRAGIPLATSFLFHLLELIGAV